eukprot:s109_g20.t1
MACSCGRYGGPQADYDKHVGLYASMAGPGVTSGSNYKGKGSRQCGAAENRVGAMAEGVAEVTFEVSLLSGTAASISCPADASLGSLVRDIGLKLGLMKEKAMPSLFFLPSSAETGAEPLQELQNRVVGETVTAGELANQSILAGVHSEPEWCTQKCLRKYWIHGRHCGMEEDSEDFVLKLYAGGKFTYSAKYHSHDAECGYNYDRSMDASGTWQLIRRDVGKEDLEEALYLEGTTTNRTVTKHSRTYYNDYNDWPSESGSGCSDSEDDAEEEEDHTPKKQTQKQTQAVELPRGKDETVTEGFTLSFAKEVLLTSDAGRCSYSSLRMLGSRLVGMKTADMAVPGWDIQRTLRAPCALSPAFLKSHTAAMAQLHQHVRQVLMLYRAGPTERLEQAQNKSMMQTYNTTEDKRKGTEELMPARSAPRAEGPSYLPPGDDHYTDDWVGGNSSWRHYMTQFSGKAADYNKYLSEYGGPQADYDKYVSLYASMAGPGVTSGSNYKGKGSRQNRVGAMAEGVAEVTFEVSLLSGTAASISCPADASLGSLVRDIGLKLGLMKEKAMLGPRHSEPEWCTQKCFKKSWIHGRHCGKEEDSEDFVLKLYAGGKFNFSEKVHSHDAECGYNYDRDMDAPFLPLLEGFAVVNVVWDVEVTKCCQYAISNAGDVGKEDLEEAVYLEGTATTHTAESHTRTYYNEDEEDLPESKDETLTEGFTLSFAKEVLLTPDAGRSSYSLQSQLSAWNKSMMQTYNTYIPGPYENFAEQATEERAESGGNSVGQGTMGEGGGGAGGGGGMVPGGGHEKGSGSGGLPWGHATPIHGSPKDHFYEHGGQVGYEPFAQPWVSQYATDEGGHNAFSYEGKEFASGGMEMGSVGDFAEYMRDYALNWLPESSQAQVESDKSSESSKAVSLAAMPEKVGGVPAQPQAENAEEHSFPEPSMPMQPQLPASAEQPEVHALQEDPAIVRAEVQAAEEAARAAAALQQLQQAAKDGAYAQWTLRRHGLRSAASAESNRRAQDLQDAMARLRQVTQEPLTQRNVKELENAGRSASDAISRLQGAETAALRQRATEAKHQLLQGAKGWVAGIERQAKSPQLAQQAKEAGDQLEKSLTAALSEATQRTAEASMHRAAERRALLTGILSQAADMASPAKTADKAEEAKDKATPESFVERSTPLLEPKMKAVSGELLLAAVCVVGALYGLVGFALRRRTAPRSDSRDIALLTMA